MASEQTTGPTDLIRDLQRTIALYSLCLSVSISLAVVFGMAWWRAVHAV